MHRRRHILAKQNKTKKQKMAVEDDESNFKKARWERATFGGSNESSSYYLVVLPRRLIFMDDEGPLVHTNHR